VVRGHSTSPLSHGKILVSCLGVKNLLKVIGLGFLGIVAGAVYLTGLCTQNWCTPFSVQKISQAVDFASCRDLGFVVIPSHPQRCTAGMKEFLEDEYASVRLSQPLDNAVATLPLRIVGEAALKAGEALQYRLQDRDGFVLDDRIIPVAPDASGASIPFVIDASYPRPLGTGGTLVLSVTDVKGRESGEAISVPLLFQSEDAVEIKVYFGNRERDPESVACDAAYPVPRRVPRADNLAQDALRELLKGPSLSEERQKFFTSIPDGVRVQDVAWADGVLTVDFSSALTHDMGGSCKVSAIRAQIEKTLQQFPSVRSVRITVNGEEEGVLEP